MKVATICLLFLINQVRSAPSNPEQPEGMKEVLVRILSTADIDSFSVGGHAGEPAKEKNSEAITQTPINQPVNKPAPTLSRSAAPLTISPSTLAQSNSSEIVTSAPANQKLAEEDDEN